MSHWYLKQVSSWECIPFISDILNMPLLWNPDGISFNTDLYLLQNWYWHKIRWRFIRLKCKTIEYIFLDVVEFLALSD